MFCRKCGYELPSDADFCPKCGTRVINEEIVSTNNNEDVQKINKPFGERDKKASVEDVKQFGVNQNSFSTRIESSDDRETNDALFSLYEKLIEPVKHIEGLVHKIKANQAEIDDKRTYKNPKINLGVYIEMSIFLGIFILVCLFICKYLVVVKGSNINWYTVRKSLIFKNIVLSSSVISIVFAIICYQIDKFTKKVKAKKQYERALTIASKIEVENNRLKEELTMVIERYKPAIMYVNVSYRTSEALSFFVQGYRNADFCTLQEAQREYREELKHQEAMYKLDSIISELASIQALQVETADVLYRVNQSIKWLVAEAIIY